MAQASRVKKGAKKVKNINRPARRKATRGRPAKPGRCGSAYCTKATGCEPWK